MTFTQNTCTVFTQSLIIVEVVEEAKVTAKNVSIPLYNY